MKENENYIVAGSTMEIYLPEKIDFATSEFFASIYGLYSSYKIEILILNFTKTRFSTLPGALYTLLFSILISKVNKDNVTLQLRGINFNVLNFFMSLGLLSKLVNRAGAQIDNKFLQQEFLLIKKSVPNEKSIIFPITSISYSKDKSYFNDYTKWFVDNFSLFFSKLVQYPIYRFSSSSIDFQELFETLFEIIKNIFDHSESEGFGGIHASRSNHGTTIAFYDYGIGIVKSVLKSKKEIVAQSEIDIIKWALKDGNSSKKEGGNQGHGLTILQDFCKSKNAILTIRTGKHQFTFTAIKIVIKPVSDFPGTQIVLYNPN